MNFILANLDFAKMSAEGFRQIHLLPLAEGLPLGWTRAGRMEALRDGIADGVFYPALHGTTHFCRSAVERNLNVEGERANLLRTLWRAGTPYIHWRMPWIGYEYWDPEQPEDERFLPAEKQTELIGQTVGAFAKLFSTLPRSACAPGYRANDDTHRAWARHGIRVAQNGPGAFSSAALRSPRHSASLSHGGVRACDRSGILGRGLSAAGGELVLHEASRRLFPCIPSIFIRR